MAVVNLVKVGIVKGGFPGALADANKTSDATGVVANDLVLGHAGKILLALQPVHPQTLRVRFLEVRSVGWL